eukprot:TRINITY_DN5415_c0_g1_i1.p1 TRINITY_DN5415_c0_g1~~TRINITY_DN5415_c0_g1_i1.p1  ORF type:complete len:479 (+),score=122.11 TRINITY_DN5415_c0_g1_i1:40-1437(+)
MVKQLKVIAGERIFIDGVLRPASLHLRDGKVEKIGSLSDVPSDISPEEILILPEDQVLLPGLVDCHVHVNDPGRDAWEDFRTATSSAAWGGVTTLADMPLNSIPPTTTLANMKIKVDVARPKLWTDVCFLGGVVPGNQEEIPLMVKEGIRGFKCFLINSGVPEFVHVNAEDVKKAMEAIKNSGNPKTFLMFHAELEDETEADQDTKKEEDPLDYQTFLRSRPMSMEDRAIALVIRLCKESQVPCHIVHLSSSASLPQIRLAKSQNVPLTVETCYHYLTFAAENIPRGSPQYKCCPPIREASNRDLIWEGVRDGTIDLVVSDHSPCTEDLKRVGGGDFLKSWGGISSLQFGLSVLHTEGVIRRGCLSIADLVRLLSSNPAKLLGLDDTKGRIQVGYHADFVVFDPNVKYTVSKDIVLHKNKLTAYDGMKLTGKVLTTILRGRVIFDKDTLLQDGFPHGKPILSQMN